MVLYISALFMTSTIGRSTDEDTDIYEWFGSVPRSLMTLFQLMTLEGWPDLVRAVMEEFPLLWMFFIPFIMITSFVLLNLVTAVVVERIIAVGKQDESMAAKRAEKIRRKTLQQ